MYKYIYIYIYIFPPPAGIPWWKEPSPRWKITLKNTYPELPGGGTQKNLL